MVEALAFLPWASSVYQRAFPSLEEEACLQYVASFLVDHDRQELQMETIEVPSSETVASFHPLDSSVFSNWRGWALSSTVEMAA